MEKEILMLTKEDVGTVENLIRRMNSVERDALEHWLDDFYDWELDDADPARRPSIGRQPNDRPLQEEIEESVWCVTVEKSWAESNRP
jgi:hypothetical protein